MAERFITVPGYNTLNYTCPAGKSAIISGLTVGMGSAGTCSVYINGSPAFAKALTADTHNMIYHTGKITISENQSIAVYGNGKMQLAVLEIDSDFTGSQITTTNYFVKNTITNSIVDYNSTHVKNNITVPSITSIGAGAFANKGLTGTLTLPAGLTSIKENAFQGNAITSINLPSTLTEIGGSAFQHCTSLTSVVFPNVPTQGYVFFGCTNLWNLDVSAVTEVNFVPYFIGYYSYITKIKIGAGKTMGDHSLGKHTSAFQTLYDGNGKLAGTYTYSGSTWTKTA